MSTVDSATPDASRRAFLKGSAAAAAVVTLAPGVTLYATGADAAVTGPATSAKRWGMLIDANADAGVWDVAVAACQKEQGWGGGENPATDPQWIRKVTVKNPKTGATANMPVMCQHCDEPPCVDVCPTGASMKRADGIVLVDKHICIGCRFCMMACPYAARSFVHEPVQGQKPHMPRGKGTVEACTMCVHRVDRGQQPACVEALAASGSTAMMFGDLNDPNSDISRAVSKYVTQRIRADLNVGPGIHYRGI
ncbi:MAG: 4Fe-4S dicluster domain-containing protein [Alphaproteobacteria bacterium]|nr:4Fe-4S dicluster domain-containing protein [Alphaproteobacteria bacterium]